MFRRKFIGLTVSPLLLWAASSTALPVAQLDIVGTDVSWDAATQTVITNDPVFSLYGYGNTANVGGTDVNTSLDWYLSIAIVPKVGVGTDFGSFTMDGATYTAADFVFGAPPLETMLQWDPNDLQKHGIYETLFKTVAVTWDPTQTRSRVDVQTTQGTDPTANPGNELMYVGWDFDVSGLLAGYQLHFDLFGASCTTTGVLNVTNCAVKQFAPFSHDAGTDVPEPTTLLLFGFGLLLVGSWFEFASRRRCGRAVGAAAA